MSEAEAQRPSREPAQSLGYVPALDGLRGLAAVAVVLTHYVSPMALGKTPLTFVGGQYGVNMFFVLSGFLITTLLAEEFQRREYVDLRAFYIRRALRLTPALLAAVAGVILLGILVDKGAPLGGQGLTATPSPLEGPISWDYLSFGPRILVTIVPVSNWAWVAGYYFQPMAVAWTLAIEDQFYLLWPVVLVLLLARFSIKMIAILTFILVAIAIGWRYHLLFTVQWSTIRTDFYFTELLLGCACSLAVTGGILPSTVALRRVLSVLAMASFVVLLLMIGFVTPTAFTMISVVAGFLTAIIIVYLVVDRSSFLTSLLAWPPLVGLGLVSYGLYLWHWIWKVYPISHADLSAPVGILLTAVTVLVSYYVVERPALRLKRRFARNGEGTEVQGARLAARQLSRRRLLPLMGMGSLVIASGAVALIAPRLFPKDGTTAANSASPENAPRPTRVPKAGRKASPRANRKRDRDAKPPDLGEPTGPD